MRNFETASISRIVSIITLLVIISLATISGLIFLQYYESQKTTTTTTTTSSSTSNIIQGIIAGIVTVGPSQPTCTANQSCNVDLTGYSLVFTSQCSNATTAPCVSENFLATIARSGHYSILLAPGQYEITGMAPSCQWMGCFTTFPIKVVVEPGQQIVVNVSVDTGIR